MTKPVLNGKRRAVVWGAPGTANQSKDVSWQVNFAAPQIKVLPYLVKLGISYDPTILLRLLGMYPKETHTFALASRCKNAYNIILLSPKLEQQVHQQ